MTTIAFDGKTLACDTLILDRDDVKSYLETKIYQHGTKYYAVAGGYAKALQLIDHLEKHGETGEAFEGCSVFCYNTYTKEAVEYEGVAFPIPALHPFTAGSGGIIARTAMHLGKTAEEAVQCAIELDSGSGGKVVSVCVS